MATDVQCFLATKTYWFYAGRMTLLSAIQQPAVADKEEPIELMGNVTQVLPGMMFRVVLPNGHEA